jgi:hypothetical protein
MGFRTHSGHAASRQRPTPDRHPSGNDTGYEPAGHFRTDGMATLDPGTAFRDRLQFQMLLAP